MNDYMKDIETICGLVDIPVPRLTLDQVVLKRLLDDLATKLLTYDPTAPSTGNATVGDVVADKTFSNAAAVGLTGALTFTALPVPVPTVIADDKEISFAMAPLFADYFDAITVYDDGVAVGNATYEDGFGYTFDLTTVVDAAAAYALTAKYIAKDTVTLSDSAAADILFDVFGVSKVLTGCTDSNTDTFVYEGAAITGTLTLADGFNSLPALIDVTIDGNAAVQDTDYTYVPGTGGYTILATKTTGAVVITATATE